jgi:hypothetical protein
MTPAERAEIIVTARLLEAAKSLDLLSTGLSLVSAAIVLLGKPHRTAAIACIVCGIVAKFYSVRIALDARLFGDVVTETLTMSDLDAAFAKKSGRGWIERCRGAKRLVVTCAIATAAQCAAIVIVSM